MDEKTGSNIVDVGVDLSEFYMSVEWDILEVPAVRFVFNYRLHSTKWSHIVFSPFVAGTRNSIHVATNRTSTCELILFS